jgi:hypothetical protein
MSYPNRFQKQRLYTKKAMTDIIKKTANRRMKPSDRNNVTQSTAIHHNISSSDETKIKSEYDIAVEDVSCTLAILDCLNQSSSTELELQIANINYQCAAQKMQTIQKNIDDVKDQIRKDELYAMTLL